MKTLLLTLLLAAPLLAEELSPQPSGGGSISAGDVGIIIGSVVVSLLSLGGGSYLYGRSRAVRVEGEIKEGKEPATRDELEQLRAETRESINNLAAELGSNKSFAAEIKGKLDVILLTQQEIVKHLIKQ